MNWPLIVPSMDVSDLTSQTPTGASDSEKASAQGRYPALGQEREVLRKG